MTLDLNKIYNLLPAVYRIRDAQIALDSGSGLDPSDFNALQLLLGASQPLTALQKKALATLQAKQQRGPLQSLIEILAEQIEVLEDSLVQSYDDLFIETCADWVVPYIAALVGLKGLTDVPSAGYTVRAAVADAIQNRRAKGTVPALEAIAREITVWDANVVEFFQVLSTTQFMNHIRLGNISVADIRNADHAMLNTPFDRYARTAEMRNVETRLGKYNIPNIGIFLWRLAQQKMEGVPAFQLDSRRFCFDSLGKSVPLFTFSETEGPEPVRATPFNVAMPISRWMLADDLKAKSPQYYNSGSNGSIDLSWQGGPPPATKICACNLSDVRDGGGNVIGWAHQPENTIGIDPQLGRIAFPSAFPAAANLMTTWCYGFSAPMGGGPYTRTYTTTADVSVPTNATTISGALALALPKLSPTKKAVVIEIASNDYFVETPSLTIPDDYSVEIRAGSRADGIYYRPTVVLSGDWVVSAGQKTTVTLNGLLIAGGSLSVVPVVPSNLVTLRVSHSTINPASTPAIGGAPAQPPLPSLWIESGNVNVEIDHSILGAIRIGSGNTVSLTTSIVDALGPSEVAYACYLDATSAGSPLTVVNSTIIGKVHTEQMTLASDSIFYAEVATLDLWSAPVIADQLQQGCVRFCYVPPSSMLPRLFHCYPVAGKASTPEFTSLRFGDPGYCQLSDRSGLILNGADDQSEIGVFHDVFAPQRLANLNVMLSDYLRFGMEAGVFFAT